MTEAEWLSCTEVGEMSAFLQSRKNCCSVRKLRLFACACCRRVWASITDERSRKAVEYSERYAEGFGKIKELIKYRAEAAAKDAELAQNHNNPTFVPLVFSFEAIPERAAIRAAAETARPGRVRQLLEVAASVAQWTAMAVPDEKERFGPERRLQCQLFRCIVGNPFHSSPVVSAWLSPTVVSFAQVIYDDCASTVYPFLLTHWKRWVALMPLSSTTVGNQAYTSAVAGCSI